MGSKASTFSNFPKHWPLARIGDISKVKGGKRLPKGSSLTKEPTNHPYLRVVDFRDSGIDECNLMYVPNETFPKIKQYTISSEDIYISIAGTIGRIGKIPDRLDGANLTENAAKICEIKPLVERDYILAFLRSQWGKQQIDALTVGSTQPKLALFRIADIKLPLPPLSEQRSIANILGTLDDKIELNRQMNETLEAIARAIFKSWFVDFDPVRAKAEGRDPGLPPDITALFPDSFEDSELGPIPKGWKFIKMGDAVDINAINIKKGDIDGEIEYIDISSVSVGKLSEISRMDFTDAPSRARRRVKHGDTIWSCVRPNRKSYYFVHNPTENLLVSTGFAVLTPKRITPTYLYAFTTTGEFVEYLTSNADGSAYPAVRPEHFAAVDLLLPNQDTLTTFEKIIAPMRDKIAQNELESKTLAAVRDVLLPKLLSGELRVPDVETFVEEMIEHD